MSAEPAILEQWIFAKDEYGDWVGTRADGRRTALKGSMKAAQADAVAGRVVCRLWPDCDHRDADACTRAIQAARRQRRAA